LGKRDQSAAKLYVRVEGWPRINAVEDSLLPLVERPALAYRGRRVLDFVASDVDAVKVQRGNEAIALKQADGKWNVAEPFKAEADPIKADQLTGDLSRLEAVEYVKDSVKPEDLEPQYGLGKPAVSVTVNFHDPKKPARTLLIGKERPNHQEYFAKLADGDSVFAVRKDIRDTLDKAALAYLPLQFPSLAAADVAEVRVQQQGGEEYRLVRQKSVWKIATLENAAAVASLVQPMVDELTNLRAERYEAYGSKDGEKYGLDKPQLRLTVIQAPKKDAAG